MLSFRYGIPAESTQKFTLKPHTLLIDLPPVVAETSRYWGVVMCSSQVRAHSVKQNGDVMVAGTRTIHFYWQPIATSHHNNSVNFQDTAALPYKENWYGYADQVGFMSPNPKQNTVWNIVRDIVRAYPSYDEPRNSTSWKIPNTL